MIKVVRIRPRLIKALRKLPRYIVEALNAWVQDVEYVGLDKVRMLPGYHDEPLRGNRAGQRSIRLSRAYRAIYIINSDDSVEFLEIIEVHKHDY
jgi:proteic killer suppression protein